jgi:hypothetical protein
VSTNLIGSRGADETQPSTRKDYQGAFREINGDSPFSKPQFKFVELQIQVSDEQRRQVGRAYGDLILHVEG